LPVRLALSIPAEPSRHADDAFASGYACYALIFMLTSNRESASRYCPFTRRAPSKSSLCDVAEPLLKGADMLGSEYGSLRAAGLTANRTVDVPCGGADSGQGFELGLELAVPGSACCARSSPAGLPARQGSSLPTGPRSGRR
jgi:hypothetical protein